MGCSWQSQTIAIDVHELSKTDNGNKRKSHWWVWLLGFFLLLVFCDDDDNRPRQHCYMFGEDRLCFHERLPRNEFCYFEADGQVRCYDQES